MKTIQWNALDIPTGTDQADVARKLVFGDRTTERFQRALADMTSLREGSIPHTETLTSMLTTTSVTVFILCIAAFVCVSMIIIARALSPEKESNDDDSSVLAVSNVLFRDEINQTGFALLLAVAVVAGLFAHGVVSSNTSLRFAQTTNDAHTRDFYVALSLSEVQTLWRAVATNTAYFLVLERLRSSAVSLELARSNLYFGSRGVSVSDNQDKVTFAQGRNGTSDAPVDTLYTTWIDRVLQVVSLANEKEQLRPVVNELQSLAPVLLSRLRQSANIYAETGVDATGEESTIQIALLIAGVFLLLVMYVWCLRPTLRRMEQEEAGNKILLQMIPPEVRAHVPKIRTYLLTGKLVTSEDDQLANPASSELSEFVHAMEQGDTPIEECWAMLERSENVSAGFIVIDPWGTIQYANRVSLDMTGYTSLNEIVNQNVNVLMGDGHKGHHDSYLTRYASSGVSRLMHTARDVYAQAKDGSQLHVFLRLAVVVRPDTHEKMYVAEMTHYNE